MIGKTVLAAFTLMCCLMAVGVEAHEEKKEIKTMYKIFREDCFESFFTRYDFTSDPSCLKFTFSKMVGFAVISGSVIYKVPQIMKILNAGTTKGISTSSCYAEAFVFLHTMSYSRHLGLSFTVYGENVSILIQQMILLLLVYKFD